MGNTIGNTTNPNNSITGVGANENGNTYPINTFTGVGENESENENGNTTDEIATNTATNTGNLANVETDELMGNAMSNYEVPDIQEMHTTQETDDDDDHGYEAPTRHKMEIVEEMNTTKLRGF